MAFIKHMQSNANIVIVGGNNTHLFPIGFEYIVGGHTYRVTEKFYSDNTEWRRLVCSDGSLQDVTTTTIIKDLTGGKALEKLPDDTYVYKLVDQAIIVNDPNAPKVTATVEEVTEKVVKKTSPKKTASKKVKPKPKKKQ